jgi:hypothetical protein
MPLPVNDLQQVRISPLLEILQLALALLLNTQ